MCWLCTMCLTLYQTLRYIKKKKVIAFREINQSLSLTLLSFFLLLLLCLSLPFLIYPTQVKVEYWYRNGPRTQVSSNRGNYRDHRKKCFFQWSWTWDNVRLHPLHLCFNHRDGNFLKLKTTLRIERKQISQKQNKNK